MEYLKEAEKNFNRLSDLFKEELLGFRTNRATTKLVENIKVDYLGQFLTVRQLGSLSIELPLDVVIMVWDKDAITPMVKAIEDAKLGVSVSIQGNVVRVKSPSLTAERKNELVKIVKASAESFRIKMRVERDAVNKKINEETDKDMKFRAKEGLQKLVDKFNGSIDSLVEEKLKGVLE